jgi:tetratricopeptide (TPR) repeat protein
VRSGNREKAFERFREGRDAFPDHPLITFSLAQEHEHRGEIDEAFSLFDAARYPRVPAAFALSEVRFAYLWDDLDRALGYLDPVLEATFEVGNGEDRALFMEGLPFFADTWSSYAAVYKLRGDLAKASSLLDDAENKIEKYDFTYLKTFLSCLERDDFSPIVKACYAKISEEKEVDAWSGHTRLRAAILSAQASEDLSMAATLLEEPEFGPEDFPWLDDMRLLARCELAAREKKAGAERELRSAFLERQSGLFELHHALTFNLLDYQNGLRADYRAKRTR